MLHSDKLAQEFNEILNGVEIFAPLQPLDPAVTFYAPLRTSVRDLRLNPDNFQRASNAWYKDASGIYRNVGINRARFEENRLLMEPAQTNKCLNYNANPDSALTGIIEIGDPASVIRRVDDAVELAAAGLSDIAGPFVLEIDNSAGVSVAALQFDGNPNNTNVHTISAWCRKIAGGIGDCDLRYNDNSVIVPFENQAFDRIIGTGAPGNSTVKLRVQCQAGAVARMILNQYEESPVVTSPIVTEGTAGQRAADLLEYFDRSEFFSQTQGMAVVDWLPQYSELDHDAAATAILSLNTSAVSLLYHDLNAKTYDGTNAPGTALNSYSFNEFHRLAARWGPVDGEGGNNMEVGFYRAGAWVWRGLGPLNYDGSYPVAGNDSMRIGLPIIWPQKLGEIALYNENRGRAWIEANLTP